MVYDAQEHDLEDVDDPGPEEILVQADISSYVRKLIDQYLSSTDLFLRFTTWMNFL